MTAQEGIDSGFAATYVPQDVAYLRYMEANRKAARKNLAAMCCDWYAVDPTRPVPPGHAGAGLAAADFKLLADALGLDQASERAPGTCTECGSVMPMSAAFHQQAGYEAGLCHTCTAARRV